MKCLVAISCLVAAVTAGGYSMNGGNMFNMGGYMNGMNSMMGQNNWNGGQNHGSGSMMNQVQMMQMLQHVLSAVQEIVERRHEGRDDDDHKGGNYGIVGHMGGYNDVLSMIIGLLMGSMDHPQGGRGGQGQGHDQGLGQLIEHLGNGNRMGDIGDMLTTRMKEDLTKMLMDHMDYLETKKYFRASTMSLCLMVKAKAHMEMNNTGSMIKDLSESDLMAIGEREKNAFEMLSDNNLLYMIKELADMTDMAFEKNFYEVAALTCKSNWKYMQMRRKLDGKSDDDDDDDDKMWMKLKMLINKLMEMKEGGMMGGHESGNGEESGDQSGTESGDQSGTESGDQSGTESGDQSGTESGDGSGSA